jgi:hypothetical protein
MWVYELLKKVKIAFAVFLREIKIIGKAVILVYNRSATMNEF